ncbi:MAG: pyridoxal phosphate-dependent class II aminotransferase [Bacteroidaceae bacterium]|nr:pyridoxal phosphate-dependent class II aminotransferase [Bacteroidaceae bacterium]
MINGHGDDIHLYDGIRINFSSNIYNHFDHERLFCHLANQLDHVSNYPEPAPFGLEQSMAPLLGLQAEQLMVTNGATEAIYLIAQTFRRKRSAVITPTFSEYADACRMHDHQLNHIYNLSQVHNDYDIVWLCNPNNPTGSVIDKDDLTASIVAHPDILFVVDASYARFTQRPLITTSEAVFHSNLLMLHSLTKEYGIPGLRIGYVTGNASLLDDLRRQRMPWAVNQVAIDAAYYLLAHSDEYEFDLSALMSERERVSRQLMAIGGVIVWPSDTHILLCQLTIGKASALKEYLVHEHGILIRDASNFAGLGPNYFRIAVQTPEENDELIEAIKQWCWK